MAPTATVVGTPVPRKPIEAAASLAAQISGIPIDLDMAVSALQTVGCDVAVQGENVAATPPPWRNDLTDPYDLVEEVIRIVGYDKVPSVVPAAPAGRGLSRAQRLRRRVSRAVAAAGYAEVWSYPFVSADDLSRLGVFGDDSRRTAVRIANPLSDEQPLLRTTLLPGLLRTLAMNVGRAQSDVALFEMGSVFLPEPDGPGQAPELGVDRRPTVEELKQLAATLPRQPLHLGAVLSGLRTPASWWGDERSSCWADAVELCRELGRGLGVPVEVVAGQRAPWHPGRCALIAVSEAVIGAAGELHPRVCTAFGVPARTSAVEIDLTVLLSHAVDIVPTPSLSAYPIGKEDVALVVNSDIPAADVAAALQAGAGDLLESLRLFDVYDGEQVASGKKSLAFSLRFRALDHTLSDAEIKAARDGAVQAAADQVGASLRAFRAQ